MDVFRLLGEAHVAENGAALLRETRHVEHADALAFKMRRHAENAADGDDAGAADAGDDDVVGLLDRRQLRIGQHRQIMIGGDALALFQLGAMHRDERRAEALDAGKVLVAARLIDGALAAPLGLERLHRHAIRFDAAIAAAFADQFVDDDALVGIGKSMPLAAPALFGRAGLIVDQHRDAGDGRELLLHRDQIVAVMDGQPGGQAVPLGYLSGSSVTTTTRLAPSAATWRATCGTVRPPSLAWPPVIATASLNRIL